MKLYNKTPYASEPLRALLEVAGRVAGARTAGVVVKITLARGTQVRGFAQQFAFWHLYIQIQLPHPKWPFDPLEKAERFFDAAIHEWTHIRDFQEHLPIAQPGPGGRRPPHDSRIEEIRAENAVYDARERGVHRRHQDAIIALALAFEKRKQAGGLPAAGEVVSKSKGKRFCLTSKTSCGSGMVGYLPREQTDNDVSSQFNRRFG